MNIRTLGIVALIILAVGLLLAFETNRSNRAQPVNANAIRTEAVATYAFSLTGTLAPIPTASFTLTSLPTFTPSGTGLEIESPVPQNTCYNLLWLKDKTVPDGTHMNANEVFTKTWQVQNNGGCAWAPGFSFSHVGGDAMRGKSFVLPEPIPVGAKRELSVEMVAPAGQDGLVQSSWRMADAAGNFFGDTLSVNIVVGDNAVSTMTKAP